MNVSPTLRAGGNRTGGDRPPGTDVDTADSLIVTHTLRAEGFDASEDGTGRGTPLVPVAFHPTQDPISSMDGSTHALGCGSSKGQASVAVAFYANEGSQGSGNNVECAPTLKAHPKTSNLAAVAQHMAVRRLTPTECERLQGFPDGYTMIPWKKKPADECPDGPRYKALGNSMAVPVMAWIGTRIADHISTAENPIPMETAA